VEGNTDLKGGVIASEAEKEKNKLDTGSLTYSNIENESKYSSVSASVSLGVGAGGGMKPSAGVPIQGQKTSTTYAAVSPGTITTRNGEQDLSGLSRDTANATNAIANIFDKAKVAERKELVDVFGQEAYRAVGDLAKHFTRPYEEARQKESAALAYRALMEKTAAGEELTKAEQSDLDRYTQAGFTPENVGMVLNEAEQTKAKYQAQYDTWKDGSAMKTALHAAVGAMQAGLAGGSAVYGGIGAGTSERMSEITAKLPDSIKPFASMVIGAAAAKITGASGLNTVAGGATADYGAKFNRKLHEDELTRIGELAKQRAAELGLDPGQVENELQAVACAMVHCADQIPIEERLDSPAFQQQLMGGLLRAQYPELVQVLVDGAGTFTDKYGRARTMFSYTTFASEGADLDRTDEYNDIRRGTANGRPTPSQNAIRARNVAALEDYAEQLRQQTEAAWQLERTLRTEFTEEGTKDGNLPEFLRNYTLFHGGETGAFGVPYKNAYEDLAFTEARINALPEIINWVKNQTAAGNQLTVADIDTKTVQYAQTQAIFTNWVSPWIYAGLGATGMGTRSAGPVTPGWSPGRASSTAEQNQNTGKGFEPGSPLEKLAGENSAKPTTQNGNPGKAYEAGSPLEELGARNTVERPQPLTPSEGGSLTGPPAVPNGNGVNNPEIVRSLARQN
jgi:hypothetical protein